jgi:hypothetical protein
MRGVGRRSRPGVRMMERERLREATDVAATAVVASHASVGLGGMFGQGFIRREVFTSRESWI